MTHRLRLILSLALVALIGLAPAASLAQDERGPRKEVWRETHRLSHGEQSRPAAPRPAGAASRARQLRMAPLDPQAESPLALVMGLVPGVIRVCGWHWLCQCWSAGEDNPALA